MMNKNADTRSGKSIISKTGEWVVISTFLCFLYSLLFWYLWIIKLSSEILGMGLGLGGAIYFVFFGPVVLFSSLIYQYIAGLFLDRRDLSNSIRLLITLWIPFLVISILMLVFCPTDGRESYLDALFNRLFE